MNKAVILLGSNTGDKEVNLEIARNYIVERAGSIGNFSRIYETEPWGNNNQPFFLNQVLELFTLSDPRKLLNTILEIEEEMGRKRSAKWAPRLIDIDILYFNNEIINEEGLKIPHPFLHERGFTLKPLCEILPELIHPVLLKKNSELLANLNDNLSAIVLNNKISTE